MLLMLYLCIIITTYIYIYIYIYIHICQGFSDRLPCRGQVLRNTLIIIFQNLFSCYVRISYSRGQLLFTAARGPANTHISCRTTSPQNPPQKSVGYFRRRQLRSGIHDLEFRRRSDLQRLLIVLLPLYTSIIAISLLLPLTIYHCYYIGSKLALVLARVVSLAPVAVLSLSLRSVSIISIFEFSI